MRLFFATDVHGSDRCFLKFLNAADAYDADALILGGDITGKRIVPMVADGSGAYRGDLAGQPVELSSEHEIREFEQATANAGLYAYRTDAEEVREFEQDPEKVEAVFRELAARRLEQWLELAQDRLGTDPPRVFINCGNDDPFELDRLIEDAGAATFLEGKAVRLDERRVLVSCGFANDTPWHCARDISEEELSRRLEDAIGLADDDAQLIVNFHAPPHGSGLDECPQLDEEMRPVTIGGQTVVGPVGSTAVRAAVEDHQPILSLHGHVHESRGVANLGRTLAINPGSEYPEGVLRGAVVDLDAEGVLSYVLTSG